MTDPKKSPDEFIEELTKDMRDAAEAADQTRMPENVLSDTPRLSTTEIADTVRDIIKDIGQDDRRFESLVVKGNSDAYMRLVDRLEINLASSPHATERDMASRLGAVADAIARMVLDAAFFEFTDAAKLAEERGESNAASIAVLITAHLRASVNLAINIISASWARSAFDENDECAPLAKMVTGGHLDHAEMLNELFSSLSDSPHDPRDVAQMVFGPDVCGHPATARNVAQSGLMAVHMGVLEAQNPDLAEAMGRMTPEEVEDTMKDVINRDGRTYVQSKPDESAA